MIKAEQTKKVKTEFLKSRNLDFLLKHAEQYVKQGYTVTLKENDYFSSYEIKASREEIEHE